MRAMIGRLAAVAVGAIAASSLALTTAGAQQFTFVTQEQLGLQPLDLVYVLDPDNLQSIPRLGAAVADTDLGSRSELDDRVRDFVLRQPALGVRARNR